MTEKYTPQAGDYIRVQGNKQYLPVPNRVQWMRGDHPDWGITTDVFLLDWDAGYVVMRAEVIDDQGRIIGQGTKTETRKGFGDFVEKAETGAVGRALARAGYGTEDALDLEGDRYADAPIEQPERSRGGSPSSPRGSAPVRTPEEQALLDELLALPGMTHARMSLLADAAHVEKGTRATATQLREMLRIAQEPLTQPGQPELAHSGSSPAPAEDTVQSEGMPVSAGSDGTEGEEDSFGSASPTDTPGSSAMPMSDPATAPPVASPPPVGSAPSDPPGITADTDELASYPLSDEEILAAAGPGAEIVPPELQERIAKARAKGKKAEPQQETLTEALGGVTSD